MVLKGFSRSHGFLTCFRAIFRSDLRFLQGNGIFAKTSAFSACPTYFQRVFLSAKTFRCFQRKTAVRIDSERKKPKKPRVTETSAAFAVRPSVSVFCSDLSMFSRICDRRANFRRAFADFSLFDRIFRVFADSLPQSRRSGLFKRVSRRFTSLYAPVKESFLAPLSSFDLSCFRHRTVSFLFRRSV